MPYKKKEDRTEYMRRYRERKLEEAACLEGEESDTKLEEYREAGLTKNEAFIEMVFHKAMEGKNAKYAELWWKMTKPQDDKPGSFTLTGDDLFRINREAKKQLIAEGYTVTEDDIDNLVCSECHRRAKVGEKFYVNDEPKQK